MFIALLSLLFMLSPAPKDVYSIKFKSIDGQEMSLAQFKGKKILIVNTASECGYTPQYKQLEALHKQYGNKLVVIGFPCNDFGGQEPGTAEEIESFCQKNYGVSFPLAEKVVIKGKDRHPLYQWLMSKSMNGVKDAEVRWNFTKFLLDESGNLMEVFPSSVTPLDEKITALL
jgi:glutathione peroxidase